MTSTIQESRDVDTTPVGPAPLRDTLRQRSASLTEPPVKDHVRQGIGGQVGNERTVEVNLVARDDDKASTTVPPWALAHCDAYHASEASADGCILTGALPTVHGGTMLLMRLFVGFPLQAPGPGR
jgi:hypothetical protein